MKSKISLPQGSPTDNVKWSLLLGYRNYIMHCFLFPFCVITCYLEVYDAEFWTENLKDISKYIYKYFIEKDEKENVVKGIVKCEQKLDTELDGSMLFNDIYRITNDTNFQFKILHHILPNNKLLHKMGIKKTYYHLVQYQVFVHISQCL
jgi:hypothetical protein